MLAPDSVLIGSYRYWEVGLSILISVLSSHSSLALTGRVNDTRGWRRFTWFVGGGAAMGIGIWSMHYTAMMSFRLPVPVQYDWPTSLLSLVIAIAASVGALIVASRATMAPHRAVIGGLFMGGAIVGMHYMGMASMRLPATDHYSPRRVTLSVLIAIVFSWLALQLAFHFRNEASSVNLQRAGSSLLMGAAISAMHYTGMAAVTFTFSGVPPDLSHAISISALAIGGIGLVTLTGLEIYILVSLVDRLREKTALMDKLFEQAPEAVALTTTDDHVTRVNKQFTRVFGYSMNEAVGHRLSKLIVPDDAIDEYKRFVAEAARGERVESEAVRHRKDGSRIYVSVVRVPVSLPGGQVVTYAIFRDITESKKAEEQLKTTSEQLRALSARLQSAREEEATRIAREIHDQLGSGLSIVKWDIELIEKDLIQVLGRGQLSNTRERIPAIKRIIDDLINMTRRISGELRPSALDDLGLVAAIRWHAREFEGRTGIVTQVGSSFEDIHLTREQSTAVFRIFEEAMTNVMRHAQATQVDIKLEKENGELESTIRDNGRGITAAEQSDRLSLGLLGMRERASLIGGRVDIANSEGKGTVVTLRVPVA